MDRRSKHAIAIHKLEIASSQPVLLIIQEAVPVHTALIVVAGGVVEEALIADREVNHQSAFKVT